MDQTKHYQLSQWNQKDRPTFIGDLNGDFQKIDKALHENATAVEDATGIIVNRSAWFNYMVGTGAVPDTPPTPEVLSVEVSPKTASIISGGTAVAFSASVAVMGAASAGVVWSVEPEVEGVTISALGTLNASADVESQTVDVIATSEFDASKSDRATVNIIKEG